MREREINLIDLVVEIMLRWRVIIIWMLVGGILMGGLSYARSYHIAKEQEARRAELEQEFQEKEEQQEFSQQEYLREQLTLQQENNIDTVLNYEKYVAGVQAYIDNSVLMQIDAQKAPRIELTFLVKASDAEESASIEKVYEDTVSNGFIQWLVESGQSDLDSTALRELVSLSRSSRSLIMGSDSFSVSIIHLTEEQCTWLAEQVIDYMDFRQRQLQELMGPHTIEVVNQSFAYVTDTSLMGSQKNIRHEVETFTVSLVQYKTSFSDEEWRYYNFVTTGKAMGAPKEYRSDSKEDATENLEDDAFGILETIIVTPPSVRVKYVIVGMILFVFMYMFYVFMKYILNNRLRANDDMKEIYGIPQLAIISSNLNVKKPFDFVDCWIQKLRNRNKRVFSEDEAIGLAAVAVKMQAKKEELDNVYFIGCDIKEKSMKVAEQIQDALKEENILMTVLNNVLYNQETMEQLQGAKGVFLLEKVGETLYDEIFKELELLQRQGIKILGAIVVD